MFTRRLNGGLRRFRGFQGRVRPVRRFFGGFAIGRLTVHLGNGLYG
jgi:hypothetical protein